MGGAATGEREVEAIWTVEVYIDDIWLPSGQFCLIREEAVKKMRRWIRADKTVKREARYRVTEWRRNGS
jgi:hypothetical protein